VKDGKATVARHSKVDLHRSTAPKALGKYLCAEKRFTHAAPQPVPFQEYALAVVVDGNPLRLLSAGKD